MRWPLCSVAFLYIAGLLLGRWLPLPLPALFACSFAAALAAFATFRHDHDRARLPALWLLLVLTGWTNMACHSAIVSPADLRLLAGAKPSLASVRGTLQASPTARVFERSSHDLWHSSAVLVAHQILLDETWQPASGKIIAYTSGLLSSNFFQGQSVEVAGVLDLPPGPRAPGLFDARTFYEHQGIYYQLRADPANDWNIPPQSPPLPIPLSDRFSVWARHALALGLGPEDTPLHLLWTLALDWKAPLTEPIEEPFLRAGTFHIFAVDGLRIGLLTAIGVGLLRALRMPRAVSGLLVVPAIWFYTAFTGWPASAVRAAIMMTIVIIGWAGRRPVDLVNSLFAAALVILLWEPGQLFQPGFQLSFLVVLCIALLLPLIQKLFLSRVFKTDPFLPDSLKSRWPGALRAAVIFIIDTSALSLAAWLGSIPLAAAYFHLFTPASVPANILVVPLTALALMGVMASLLTAAWFPALAVLFNHANWFLMSIIIHLSQWASHCPGGAFNVAAPSLVTFALYYLILFAVLTGWIFRSKFKWPASFAIFALVLGWLAQWSAENRVARFYFLPLQGGAAICATRAGPGKPVLFDCGNPRIAESVVKPFLAAQGINSLDALILTVGHVQDIGGAEIILTHFPARRVFLNPARDRSSAYRQNIDHIKSAAPFQDVSAGDNARGWTVLHPPPSARFDDADDNAMVLQRTVNGQSILLLSSLGRTGQDALVASHPDLRADIVVAKLPAQDEPLSPPLLQLLRPKLIVILDSENPATRCAAAKLRARLSTQSAPVVYGSDAGSLQLSLSAGGWNLKTAGGETLLTAP
jgi:competence protein ComEC